MAEQELTPRQERAAERLLEDEGLTGGLSDDQAAPLIRWASAQAAALAAPGLHNDETLAELLAALRAAVRAAARAAVHEPDALLALAIERFGTATPPAPAQAPAANQPEPVAPTTPRGSPTADQLAPVVPAQVGQLPPTDAPPVRTGRLTLLLRRISLFSHRVFRRR